MRAWFFGLILALAALPVAAQPKPDLAPPPETERYVCPSTNPLNCMPIVPAERRAFCRKSYLEWAAKNCPGLKVVH